MVRLDSRGSFLSVANLNTPFIIYAVGLNDTQKLYSGATFCPMRSILAIRATSQVLIFMP